MADLGLCGVDGSGGDIACNGDEWFWECVIVECMAA